LINGVILSDAAHQLCWRAVESKDPEHDGIGNAESGFLMTSVEKKLSTSMTSMKIGVIRLAALASDDIFENC
jgi:hypothetical protein